MKPPSWIGWRTRPPPGSKPRFPSAWVRLDAGASPTCRWPGTARRPPGPREEGGRPFPRVRPRRQVLALAQARGGPERRRPPGVCAWNELAPALSYIERARCARPLGDSVMSFPAGPRAVVPDAHAGLRREPGRGQAFNPLQSKHLALVATRRDRRRGGGTRPGRAVQTPGRLHPAARSDGPEAASGRAGGQEVARDARDGCRS